MIPPDLLQFPKPPSVQPIVPSTSKMAEARKFLAGVVDQLTSLPDDDRVRDWLFSNLVELFKGTGIVVETESSPPESAKNIWVTFEGAESQTGGLIIAAHYDRVRRTAGADDNISGVAVLLLLLKSMVRDGWWPSAPLMVIFPDGEERGMIGSAHFAKTHARFIKSKFAGMIALDCVGYYIDNRFSHRINRTSPLYHPYRFDTARLEIPRDGAWIGFDSSWRSRDFLKRAFDAFSHVSPMSAVNIYGKNYKGQQRSDNVEFEQHADIPGIMITDTANYRNPHYHKPTDTPPTLNWTVYPMAAVSIVEMVKRLTGCVSSMGRMGLLVRRTQMSRGQMKQMAFEYPREPERRFGWS